MGAQRTPGPLRWLTHQRRAVLRDLTFTPMSNGMYRGTYTPSSPGKEKNPANQEAVSLKDYIVTLDKNGTLSGRGALSLPSGYPSSLAEPTDIPVSIRATGLEVSRDSLLEVAFDGYAAYGPAAMDFTLKLRYDTARLAKNLTATLSRGGGVTETGKWLQKEFTHPGFDVSGVVELAVLKQIPLLKKILRTKLKLSAPTTLSLKRPLPPDGMTPFPVSYRLSGVVPVPAGAVFDSSTVGLGFTRGQSGEKAGHSFPMAGLPVLSPPALTAGDLKRIFTLYLYVEYYKVWRVSTGLDLGVRLTFSPSTEDTTPSVHPLQHQYQQAKSRPWLPASRENGKPEAYKPWVIGQLELTFDWF